MRRRLTGLVVEFWLPIVLLVAIGLLSAKSTSIYFPPLTSVLETFRRLWLFDQVPTDVLPSLRTLSIGFLLAVAGGVALGMIMGLARTAYEVVSPFIEILRAIPGVALLPLLLLIFGIGAPMQIAIIAYASAWPVLLNTIDGVRGVEPTQLDMARAYRLPAFQRLVFVILPAASPQILTGVRSSLSLSVTVIFFSELVGSTHGIGHRMLEYQRDFAIPEMWSGILLMGLLGYGLNVAFRGVEAYALRWRRGMQSGARGHTGAVAPGRPKPAKAAS